MCLLDLDLTSLGIFDIPSFRPRDNVPLRFAQSKCMRSIHTRESSWRSHGGHEAMKVPKRPTSIKRSARVVIHSNDQLSVIHSVTRTYSEVIKQPSNQTVHQSHKQLITQPNNITSKPATSYSINHLANQAIN